MSLNIEKLAEALKLNTVLTNEELEQVKQMRETGLYGIYSAREELLAKKILLRISELVDIIERIKNV